MESDLVFLSQISDSSKKDQTYPYPQTLAIAVGFTQGQALFPTAIVIPGYMA